MLWKRCGQKVTHAEQLSSTRGVSKDEAHNVKKSLLTSSQAFPVAETCLDPCPVLRAYIKKEDSQENE